MTEFISGKDTANLFWALIWYNTKGNRAARTDIAEQAMVAHQGNPVVVWTISSALCTCSAIAHEDVVGSNAVEVARQTSYAVDVLNILIPAGRRIAWIHEVVVANRCIRLSQVVQPLTIEHFNLSMMNSRHWPIVLGFEFWSEKGECHHFEMQ